MTKHLPAILILSFVLSGCVGGLTGSGDEKGAAEMEFAKGAMVKGFPPVPSYKNAKLIESFGSKDSFGASFYTSDDLGKVVNYYNATLPASGLQTTLKKRSDTNLIFEVKSDSYEGKVIINSASNGEDTAITMSFNKR